MSNIPDFKTQHFLVPGEQISKWNEGKIALPDRIRLSEDQEVQFIAPENLVAILRAPFYFDWPYETDGRIKFFPFEGSKSLVYGEEWVGKRITHFPYCKELLEIYEWLKRNGWSVPFSWEPIVESIGHQLADKKGAPRRYYKLDRSLPKFLLKDYKIGPTGDVSNGRLYNADDTGYYWTSKDAPVTQGYLILISYDDGIIPKDIFYPWDDPICPACSVRCVC